MGEQSGRRARKKAETRERIADAAARLFAEIGYDATSMAAVAEAADVSIQTAYNYFPMKHELVLDRSEQFREMYRAAVATRARGVTPAAAIRPLVHADIERVLGEDSVLVAGEFHALCVRSGELRRFALEMRESHAQAVTEAIELTTVVPPMVAAAHAAALIAVVQLVSDRIGECVLNSTYSPSTAADILGQADEAFDALDRAFDYQPRPAVGAV